MTDESRKRQGTGRYVQILEHVFAEKYAPGMRDVPFERSDLERAATALSIPLPKNLGDNIYSFRYRRILPESIRATAPEGEEWIIRPAGKALYRFALIKIVNIVPNINLAEIKTPDATPDIVEKYSQGDDEQALLAKVRYNRLIDIFSGVTCYSLQNHLRTTVEGLGQVETDEIYVGVDRYGAHYIFPVQAKTKRDKIGIVQIEQDMALCEQRFPELICRPIAVQFMEDKLIALFFFGKQDDEIKLLHERHYRLLPHDQLTDEDLRNYRMWSMEGPQ